MAHRPTRTPAAAHARHVLLLLLLLLLLLWLLWLLWLLHVVAHPWHVRVHDLCRLRETLAWARTLWLRSAALSPSK
jgi:hypothetical protein